MRSLPQSFTLSLPPWEILHAATLDATGALAAGERLRPVEHTVGRSHAAGFDTVTPRCHYDLSDLPDGTVLVVLGTNRRYPDRALLVRARECVPIPEVEAEDLLDPAGARCRAWQRRVRRTLLRPEPVRHTLGPGHGFEADTLADWQGEEYVAACVRTTARQVWVRAATFEEAEALGVA
ncbi:hypothetical protein [uncultured Methylobacterium sp.]|uniref:hypothetical protein n=1 Tax=uncultured Methylobacterium sp. TaxID=157278 RepID=UPI0035CC37AD